MFTSAHQVTNLFSLAKQMGLEEQLTSQFDECVVVSIGPTTTEWMKHLSLPVDLEPDSPKMGPMVIAAARSSQDLKQRKKRIRHMLSGPSSDVLDPNARGLTARL